MINSNYSFKKEDLINCGTFGKVYKGLDSYGTHVAIKVIKTKDYSPSETQYHKLISEYNAPHIARYRSDYSLGKRHCIVMDFVIGPNLSESEEQLTYPEIHSLVFQTLEFLSVLERIGVVYRDLKPGNMLWDPLSKTLKIVDFGSLQRNCNKAPDEGVTARYAPPDFILGKRLSGAFDLWSLGVIIYELFCRKAPFPVQADFLYNHWEEQYEEGLLLTVQRIGLPGATYLRDCSKRDKYFDLEGNLLKMDNFFESKYFDSKGKLNIADIFPAVIWSGPFLEALGKHEMSNHDKASWFDFMTRLLSYKDRGTAYEHIQNPLFHTHFHLHYDTAQKCQMFVHRTALLTGKPLHEMGPEDLQNPDLAIDFSKYQGECLHIPKDPNDQYLFILKNGEKTCTAYSPIETGTVVTIKHLQDLVDPPAAEPSSKKVKSSRDEK